MDTIKDAVALFSFSVIFLSYLDHPMPDRTHRDSVIIGAKPIHIIMPFTKVSIIEHLRTGTV